MKPDGTNLSTKVLAMYNDEGESVDSAPHSRQILRLELDQIPEKYDILRVKATEPQ